MIATVYGVDFSGAKLAGLNIWIAQVDFAAPPRPRLESLRRLGELAGTDDRAPALDYLVQLILTSNQALWGIDFPFGLPVEIVEGAWGFRDQLGWVDGYAGDAYAFGRECVERAKRVGDKLHIRRTTDSETKTPFDCYHYRIICQTFHGMRDVLRRIAGTKGTIIPPFDRVRRFDRAVVEACPGSTLKRWGAPHNNYKQPAGGPLEAKRVRNRKLILTELTQRIDIAPHFIRAIQRNPGGDALDAVIAAAGVWEAWNASDWRAIERHPRYSREGKVFA